MFEHPHMEAATRIAAPRPLRVASWPGFGAAHNPFLPVFLKGLEEAGAEVTGLENADGFPADWDRDWPGEPPDILLLHWVERIFGESRRRWQAMAKMRRILHSLARRPSGTRAVWLVHNLSPHDPRPVQRLTWGAYTLSLARRVDGFLTLSPGTVGQVRAALPGLAAKPALGLWHPAYPGATLSAAERAEARAAFGWSDAERVLGYCGQIRPYKGTEELVRVFRHTLDPGLRLLLAGRPGNAELAGWLSREAALDPRIALRLENIDAPSFRAALGTCDVVVAPLRDYLHSGSLVHALSAGRAALTPATPFAESLQARLGAGWVRTYEGDLSPGLLAAQRPADGAPDLSDFDAGTVGRTALGFFRTLAG